MDIFCEAKQKLGAVIIEETKHFLLLHDGFPLMEGHLFLIPRHHVDCFLDIEPRYRKELNEFIGQIYRFLAETCREPVVFEHGVIAQTIPHAHLHFLPTDVSIRPQLERIAVPMETPEKPYLYYETGGRGTYYRVTGKIAPGFLHATYAAALGRPVESRLRADKTEEWTAHVRERWRERFNHP